MSRPEIVSDLNFIQIGHTVSDDCPRPRKCPTFPHTGNTPATTSRTMAATTSNEDDTTTPNQGTETLPLLGGIPGSDSSMRDSADVGVDGGGEGESGEREVDVADHTGAVNADAGNNKEGDSSTGAGGNDVEKAEAKPATSGRPTRARRGSANNNNAKSTRLSRSRSPVPPVTSTRSRSPVNTMAGSTRGGGGARGRSTELGDGQQMDVDDSDAGDERKTNSTVEETDGDVKDIEKSVDDGDKSNINNNEDEDDANDNTNEETSKPPQRDIVLLGEKPRGMYECDYCHADLTRIPRVRCATCPDFDLCLDCLATSNHEEMVRSKRAFQRMHRRNNERENAELLEREREKELVLKGKQEKREKNSKRVRGGKMGRGSKASSSSSSSAAASAKEEKEDDFDDPNATGSYIDGRWMPFFRHQADHGYVVADSTRYILFPPFRSVVPVGGDGEGSGGVDVEEKNNTTITWGDRSGKEAAAGDEESGKAEGGTGVSAAATDEMQGGASVNDNAEAVDVKTSIIKPTDDAEAMDIDQSENKDVTTPLESDEKKASDTDSAHAETETNKADDKCSAAIDATAAKYKVVDDSRGTPWTAEEDLRLLDGILTCGLGNWPDIAEHVNAGNNGEGTPDGVAIGGKTDKRCMERYIDDFLGRYGHILPPYTMVPVEEEEEKEGGDANDEPSEPATVSERKRMRRSISAVDDPNAPGFRKRKFLVVPTDELEEASSAWPHPYVPPNMGIKIGDEVARDLWYRSEQSFVRQCSSAGSKLDVEAIRKDFIERRAKGMVGYEAKVLPPRLEDVRNYPGSELAGFMPRRGDFDLEWDNEAEHMIADMEFSTEDSKADRDLKVEVIKIFNSKLDEREKRKQFIIDQGLLNYRANQEKMQKLPADERHLIHRMRLFARFHSKEEHEELVQKVLKAKRLRKEIAKLQSYRRLGITSLADAEKYELDKSRREFHRMAWLKKEAEAKKAEADAARAAKENAGGGFEGALLGTAATQSLGIWRQYQSSGSKRRKMAGVAADETGAFDYQGTSQKTPEKGDAMETEAPAEEPTKTKPALQEKFVIKDKPGFALLSSKEKELCKRLRLLPQHYLDVKKALLSESLAAGIWDQRGQKKPFVTIDVEQRDDIIDFVLKAGWISARPSIIETEK